MSPHLFATTLSGALALIVSLVPYSAAQATACIPGHGTTVLPCTFDDGLLVLSNSTTPDLEGGGGGGHHTLLLFSGSDITIEADVGHGALPYNSNDGGTGTDGGTVTFMVTTASGLPLIQDYGLSLIDPNVSGTGTISWSLGALTGDQTVTSGDFVLPTPVNSLTDTLSITLNSGADGDASVVGVTIDISVPEPASLALLGAGLLGMAVSRRRL